MCFVDVLRDNIKAVIRVHRPSTLDNACSLTLVQEEAMATVTPRILELNFFFSFLHSPNSSITLSFFLFLLAKP
jgi:hypothetical protein